jgi:hypothetical protein
MTSSHPYRVAFFIQYGKKNKIYTAAIACLDRIF